MDGSRDDPLSEVSQRKTNSIWHHLHMDSKKWYKWTYLPNRNRLTEEENKLMEHLAGGPVVKNPPCNADARSIPGGGTKIPQAAEPRSPWAATPEPACFGACITARESTHHKERFCMMRRRSHVLQLRPKAAKSINKCSLKKKINSWPLKGRGRRDTLLTGGWD